MRNLNVDRLEAGDKGEARRLSQAYEAWHQNQSVPEDIDQDSPWYKLVLRHLIPTKGKRVLEVACGRGGFASVLQSLGATVCAADFSAAAIRYGTQRAIKNNIERSKLMFLQADAHHLPFVNCAFDVVISCETIEHLMNPSAALTEMSRVCKQDGLLYLTTPNYLNLMGLYLVYDAIFRKVRRNAATQPIDHRRLFLGIRRMVKRAGWRILKSDGTAHQVPFPGREPVLLNFPERNPVLSRLTSPIALHYFVMARRKES